MTEKFEGTRAPSGDTTGFAKIGHFAALVGTSVRTLRYYEEIGLCAPAARSRGGCRYYRPTDVNRLRMIQSLHDLGLSLERVRELLSTRQSETRTEFLRRVRTALKEHERLLEERQREIQGQRDRVELALAKLVQCTSCDLHPTEANSFCEPCGKDGRALPEGLSALF